MKKVKLFFLLSLLCYSASSFCQTAGIKSSLSTWATTTTNLEIMYKVTDQLTVNLPCMYNPWESFGENTKIQQLTFMPGVRYWQKEAYQKGFFGINAVLSRYHMGGLFDHAYRYDGNAYGLSFSYGYSWPIAKHWLLEVEAGAGVLYTEYAKYRWPKNSRKYGDYEKVIPMLTKFDISFSYVF